MERNYVTVTLCIENEQINLTTLPSLLLKHNHTVFVTCND